MVDKRDEADKLIDELIAGKTPEEIVGEGGLLHHLTKRLYERVLEGEMTHHLGYPPRASEGKNSGNSRNGTSTKTVKTDRADIHLAMQLLVFGQIDLSHASFTEQSDDREVRETLSCVKHGHFLLTSSMVMSSERGPSPTKDSISSVSRRAIVSGDSARLATTSRSIR